jgi:hypothetical protein
MGAPVAGCVYAASRVGSGYNANSTNLREEAAKKELSEPLWALPRSISITVVGLTDAPASFRLIPGMTLIADIKVGSRSVATDLLGGLVRNLGDEMRDR